MLPIGVRSHNGMARRGAPTVKGTAYSVAEEVAHEERERRCAGSMRLHGSGRRVVQVQGN